METLTISIPDEEVKLFKEMLTKFNAKIIIESIEKKHDVLKGLETGLKQVRALEKGKGKSYTINEIINGK